jgi:hypothetical protein
MDEIGNIWIQKEIHENERDITDGTERMGRIASICTVHGFANWLGGASWLQTLEEGRREAWILSGSVA